MLLILIFCLYVIGTGRVSITRRLTLTGTHARQFAVTLLVLMIPVTLLADILLAFVLPHAILGDPIFGRLINVVILALLALALASGFRAIESRSQPPPPTTTAV
jgi:hypothetical protein